MKPSMRKNLAIDASGRNTRAATNPGNFASRD
jgi:hypothetical protein